MGVSVNMMAQVIVDGPGGPKVFDVNLRMTGFNMKSIIAQHYNIPVRHIWLSFNGGILYNDSILFESGVRAGDTIRCFVR